MSLLDFNSLPTILALALALGCDAFSVGLAVGTRILDRRGAFRLWFHFGLFQFLMPLIGWAMGQEIWQSVKSFDHWVSFSLVAAVALKMLYESLQPEEDSREKKRYDPTRGWALVALSITTSIDALGVGFGMGVVSTKIISPALCIGLVAGIMTYVGIRLGAKLSSRIGKRAETLGALILLVVAWGLLNI